MLKIGITSCFLYPDNNRDLFKTKQLDYLENDMANYLASHDAMPILIPDLDRSNLISFMAELDGFVFQGGTDLAPASYGETPIGKWLGDAYRDNYELFIFDYAMKREKPILSICRGCQLMNVYFGGTLYQDIETQIPEALKHRDASLYDKHYHDVKFLEGSVLNQIYTKNDAKLSVNSVHHQAIKDLGQNLRVEAISPQDNVIEAIRWIGAEGAKVYGVQWHPEFAHILENQIISSAPLYDLFLAECKMYKKGKTQS